MNGSSSSCDDGRLLDEAVMTSRSSVSVGDRKRVNASDSLFATCPNFKSIENFQSLQRLSKSMYAPNKKAKWIKSTGPRNGRSSSLERLGSGANDDEIVAKLREEARAAGAFPSTIDRMEFTLPLAPVDSTFGLAAQWNSVMQSVLAACTPRDEISDFACSDGNNEQPDQQMQAANDESSVVDDLQSDVVVASNPHLQPECTPHDQAPSSPTAQLMERASSSSSARESKYSTPRDEEFESADEDDDREEKAGAENDLMSQMHHVSRIDLSREVLGDEIPGDEASISDVELEPMERESAVKIVKEAVEGMIPNCEKRRTSPHEAKLGNQADPHLQEEQNDHSRSAANNDPFHAYWERAVGFFKELQSNPAALLIEDGASLDVAEDCDKIGFNDVARDLLQQGSITDFFASHGWEENAISENACPEPLTRPQSVDDSAFRGTASLLAALVVSHVIEESRPMEFRRPSTSSESGQCPSRPNTREAAGRIYWGLANDVLQEAQTKRQPSKKSLGKCEGDHNSTPDEVMELASHVANDIVTETCRFFNEASRRLATPGASTVVSNSDEHFMSVPESSEVATLLGQALCASALDIEARSISRKQEAAQAPVVSGTLSMEFENAMRTSLHEPTITDPSDCSRLPSPDVQSVAAFSQTGKSSLGLSVTCAALTRALDTVESEENRTRDSGWAIAVRECSRANNTLTEKALQEALNQRPMPEGVYSDDGYSDWGRPCSVLASPQPASTFSGSSLAFSRTGTLHSFFSKKRSAEVSPHLPMSQSTESNHHTSEDTCQDDKLGKVFRLASGEWSEAHTSSQEEAISFAISPGHASHFHSSTESEVHDSTFLLQALQSDTSCPSGRPPLPPDVALGSTSRLKFRHTLETSQQLPPEESEPLMVQELQSSSEVDQQVEKEGDIVVDSDLALQLHIEEEPHAIAKDSEPLEDLGDASQSPSSASASALGSPSPASTINRHRGSDSPLSSRPPSRHGSGSPEPSSSRPPSRRGSGSTPSSRPASATALLSSETSVQTPTQHEPSVLQTERQTSNSIAMELIAELEQNRIEEQYCDEIDSVGDDTPLLLPPLVSPSKDAEIQLEASRDVDAEITCSTILTKSGIADASDIQLVKEQLSSLFALDHQCQAPVLSTLFEESDKSSSQTIAHPMSGQSSIAPCRFSDEGDASSKELEEKEHLPRDSPEVESAKPLTQKRNMVSSVSSGELPVSQASDAALALEKEDVRLEIAPADSHSRGGSGDPIEKEITYEVLVGNSSWHDESDEKGVMLRNGSLQDGSGEKDDFQNCEQVEILRLAESHDQPFLGDPFQLGKKAALGDIGQSMLVEADTKNENVSSGVKDIRAVVSSRSRKSKWAEIMATTPLESPSASLANTRDCPISDDRMQGQPFAFSDLDSLDEYYAYVAKRTLLREVLQLWQVGMAAYAEESATEALRYISCNNMIRRNSTGSEALSRRNSHMDCQQSSPLENTASPIGAFSDDEDEIEDANSELEVQLRPWEGEKENAADKMLRHFWALSQGSGEQDIAKCLWANGKLKYEQAPRRPLPRSGSYRAKPTAEEIAARQERRKQVLANHLASKPSQGKQAAWDIDVSPKPSPRAIYATKPPINEPPSDLFPTKWCTNSMPLLTPPHCVLVPSASAGSVVTSARRNASPAALPKLPAKRNRMVKSHSQPHGAFCRPVANSSDGPMSDRRCADDSKDLAQPSPVSSEDATPSACPLDVVSKNRIAVAVHVDPKGALTNAKAEGEFPSCKQAASIYAKSVDVVHSVTAAHARQRMKSASLPAIKVRHRGKPTEPPRMWRVSGK